MFEPEVWKMVRTLERDHVDQTVYWRTRLAQEHRTTRRGLRFWRGHMIGSQHDDRVAVRVGRALPGRGG